MAEIMQNIASLTWLILAIIFYIRMKQWNKRFSDLYDDLKNKIREEFDND